MLEDDFNDCLSKAIRGHGCPIGKLALVAGISESRINQCLNGHEDAAVIHSLSPHLQLNGDRLIALKNYKPEVHPIPGLTRVVSPYGHIGVNAYIVSYGDTSLVFDTGTDSSELHELAPEPTKVFITHGHPDHNAGLDEFRHSEVCLPETSRHGDLLKWGKLQVRLLDVSGHFTPARAYFITGLVKPICIIGDPIFAGSIGKCPTPAAYSTALANIHDHLLSLPDETILCPGHGPLTTVALEKANNPFF